LEQTETISQDVFQALLV